MAIFTTLVTATKLLVKNMAKKKLKEKAKKFITGSKDKDKDKDKEKKRAKLKRMIGGAADIATIGMFDFDKRSGGGGLRKAANAIGSSTKVVKVKPDSAKIDYDLFTEKVDNIVGMTDALVFLTGAQSDPVSYTHLTLPTKA